MNVVAVLALFVALQTGPVGGAPSSLDGRWRLVSRGVTSVPVVEELLVREDTSPPILSVEQRTRTGARFVRFTIVNPSTVSGTVAFNRASPNLAARQGAALVLRIATATQTVAAKGVEYQEAWSLVSDDTLSVTVTTRSFGGAPATVQLTYQRVPRPTLTAGQNLVANHSAVDGRAVWWFSGNARIDDCDGDPCFALQQGDSIRQTVVLPHDVGGRYVVLIGSAQVEKLSAAGDITGQPYLYALVGSTDPGRISAHLQGQQLRGQPTRALQWVTMSGVFRMPDDAYLLTFELKRAAKVGGSEPGGVARYDNLGVYAFETEEQARAFIASWRGR
jgi:hypothetical protein